MGKITDYTALSSTQPDDVLPIVDVHDFTQAGTGTTKKITVTNLLASAGGGGGGTAALTPTGIKTANYTAAAGDLVLCDSTAAGFNVTLPTAPADKTLVGVKQEAPVTPNIVHVVCGGTDQFNNDGTTNTTLQLQNEGGIWQYVAATGRWIKISNEIGRSQLDLRYAQLANNLSDVTAATARTNLGLGTAATIATPVSIANGGTGQATQQAALDAVAGATTNNQVLAGNGTHVTLRALAAADLPAGTLALLATTTATGTTGVSKINGTQNIVTWTSPNDGNMHRVIVNAVQHTTSAETGGSVQVTWTGPDGTAGTAQSLYAGGAGTGSVKASSANAVVGPNTTVAVAQNTALTAGASVVWADIYGY